MSRSTIAKCLGFLFCSTVLAFPKPATSHTDSYLINVDHIPLPNSGKVNTIVRDGRGFLWFGTTRGLYKYDGYDVRVFTHGLDTDKRQRVITGMTKTADRSLLLATWDGLWLFDLGTEQFTRFPEDSRFADGVIDAVAGDPNGTVWIGMRREGLFSYNHTTGTVRHYTTKDGLSANGISSLLLDHSGTVWIGTYSGGLNALDPTTSRFVHYRSKPSDRGTLWSDHVAAIQENDNQELWILTAEGLNVLDRPDIVETGLKRKVRRIPFFPSAEKVSVGAIAHDPSGIMWVGVQGRGIMSYFNGLWTQVAPSPDKAITLSDVFITKVYPDIVSSSHGRHVLWIGTHAGGVNKVELVKNPFTNSIRDKDALLLGRGATLSIYEDRKGIVWVGLWGGGLDALKRTSRGYKRIAHYWHDARDQFSLPNDMVVSLLEDRDGALWVGTSDGLATFDISRKRLTIYKHDKNDSTSLASNSISGICEDRMGHIWICTDSGLSRLVRGKGNHFRNYLHRTQDARAPGGNAVTDIIEDRSGNLWVSMKGGGLNKLDDGGRFIRFLHPADTSGQMENFVHNIYADSDGLFWLQTGVGLVTFDASSGVFKRYPAKQLNETQVSGIENDETGSLWLSTLGGLFRLNPKTHNFLRYGEAQGLPFKVLTSKFFRNSQGKLFVGGLNGFTEFFPESVSTPTTPPEIYITGFSVFDEAMPATIFSEPEIVLTYDQNFFSFSFAALDYTDPKNNRYVYRMVGLDRDWVDAGTRNFASYTNLDPGDYVFQVKGRNSEGIGSEESASLFIVVTPAWWQTWWFRVSAGILLVGLLVLAYKYRVSQLLRVERMRVRIASDLHDDIGSRLSSIALMSDVARVRLQKADQEGTTLSKISTIARDTANVLKDLVWAIDPECDKLGDILQRMRDVATEQLGDVVQSFHFPFEGSDIALDLNTRRNLLLLYKEALHNIQKHARASMIWIDGRLEQHTFRIEIRDNGVGFDPEIKHDGRGQKSEVGSQKPVLNPEVRDKGRDQKSEVGFNPEVTHRGRGLNTMRQRAQKIGATLDIYSEPGRGTTLVLSMKIPRTRYARHE